MSVSEFSREVVDLLWVRCAAACEICGRGLRRSARGWGWSAHHRLPRGQGGSGDARLGLASNGLVLCGSGTTGCHGRVERNRSSSIDLGWLVPAGGEPGSVPVKLDLYGLVLLGVDGLVYQPV